jgi:hypothetical protein
LRSRRVAAGFQTIFSVGIGSQRTPSSKIVPSVVFGLELGFIIDLLPDILLLQKGVALYWR